MHGVMKAKGINIGEIKTGKILCEINPEATEEEAERCRPLVKSEGLQC